MAALPDELRLRRARKRLSRSSGPCGGIPDRLRERAPAGIFARLDVQVSQLLAVHPKPNENVRKNAWLLGRTPREQQRVERSGREAYG